MICCMVHFMFSQSVLTASALLKHKKRKFSQNKGVQKILSHGKIESFEYMCVSVHNFFSNLNNMQHFLINEKVFSLVVNNYNQ